MAYFCWFLQRAFQAKHDQRMALDLRIKAFGKDGVRLLYAGGGDGAVIEVRRAVDGQENVDNAAGGWELHAGAPETEGVVVIKGGAAAASAAASAALAISGPPRLAAWRLRRGSDCSDVVQLTKPPSSSGASPCLDSPSRPPMSSPPHSFSLTHSLTLSLWPRVTARAGLTGAPAAAAPILPLDDAELAFNVLQWFGTVVVDCRPRALHRLRESVLCSDAAAAAALPPKDDAIAVGAPQEVLDALATRARRSVHVLSERALDVLCSQHPCLSGSCTAAEAAEMDEAAAGFSAAAAAAAAERRPVLPNLVDGSLLVGHQGHAVCISDWERHVPLGGVVNLAPEKVDANPAREAAVTAAARRVAAEGDGGASSADAPAWDVLELHCADGEQLTDKPGDGERLLEALPAALAFIAAGAANDRQVFIHCQQGRSRAGSIATAHLLATHEAWTLFDAVSFLSARRPETEIYEEYAQALERWAVDSLGRTPSLPRVLVELQRQIRPKPRKTSKDAGLLAPSAAPPSAPPDRKAARSAVNVGAVGGGGALPQGSPCAKGGFGAAAIRRASPAS